VLANAVISSLNTSNMLQTVGNIFTSNIGGSIGTTTIITDTQLTTIGTELLSVINGVATRTDLTNLIASGTTNIVSISTTTNEIFLATVVNGKLATTSTKTINENTLTSLGNILSTSVNGVVSTSSIINTNEVSAINGVLTSIVNGQVATTSVTNLFTFLASSTNSNLTVSTTTSGEVTFAFTDTPTFTSVNTTNLVSENANLLNASSTYATLTNATATYINTENLVALNTFITTLTANNLVSTLASILRADIANLASQNATITNSTSTNLFANNFKTNFADILGGNATLTSATSTNFFAENLKVFNQSIDELIVTNATATNLAFGLISGNKILANTATLTNSTSTNLFAENFIASSGTSTNLFASIFAATNASVDKFLSENATITNLYLSKLETTDLKASGTSILSNLYASSTLSDSLISLNATVTNATFTSIYADNIKTENVVYNSIIGNRATISEATITNIYSPGFIVSQNIFAASTTFVDATVTNLFAENFASNYLTINFGLLSEGRVDLGYGDGTYNRLGSGGDMITNEIGMGPNATNYLGGENSTNYFGNGFRSKNVFGNSDPSNFDGYNQFYGTTTMEGPLFLNYTAPFTTYIGDTLVNNATITNLNVLNLSEGTFESIATRTTNILEYSTSTNLLTSIVNGKVATTSIVVTAAQNVPDIFVGNNLSVSTTSTSTTILLNNDLVLNSASVTGVLSDNIFTNALNAVNGNIDNFIATNATSTFAFFATLTGDNARFVNATTTNLATTNITSENSTSTNLFTSSLKAINGTVDNLSYLTSVGQSAQLANISTTNITATGTTNLNTLVSQNIENNFATITSATVTNLYAQNGKISGLIVENATVTGLLVTNLTNQNIQGTYATVTNSTSTNIFAQNLNSQNVNLVNSSSTNLFANILNAITGFIGEFGFNNATGTNLHLANLFTGNLTATGTATINTANILSLNATTSMFLNASATNLFSTNLNWNTASGLAATTTYFYADTLTTKDLNLNYLRLIAQLGSATILDKLTVGSPTVANFYKANFIDNVPGTTTGSAAFSMTNLASNQSNTNTVLRLNTAAGVNTSCSPTPTASSGLAVDCARFVSFFASSTSEISGEEVGRIALGRNPGQQLQRVVYYTAGADFGENLTIEEESENGDIISKSENGNTKAYKGRVIVGVVSENTGFVGNMKKLAGINDRTVGYLGMVLTKVNLENGPIKKGDPIGVGSIPGVGVKMTKAGYIVGFANQDFNGNEIGRIEVQVAPTWYDPNVLLTGESISTTTVAKTINETLNTSNQGLVSTITNNLNNSIYSTVSSALNSFTSTSTINSAIDNLFLNAFTTEDLNILSPEFAATTTEAIERVSFVDMQKYLLRSVNELNEKIDLLNSGVIKLAEVVTDKLIAKEVKTDKLCIGDTCIYENDLKEFIEYKKTNTNQTNSVPTENKNEPITLPKEEEPVLPKEESTEPTNGDIPLNTEENTNQVTPLPEVESSSTESVPQN
jgi:hypothetical protein